MKGLLLIDKPAGWTSFDVVNFVRKMIARLEGKKPKHVKVGHTGTLDPAATGLLVLAIGKEYTSQMPTLMKQDKTYEVELTLGKSSTTGDNEGEISEVSDTVPAVKEVERVLNGFVGNQLQTPPAFSALKVNGKRAYDLARAGKEVKLEPRQITIHEISEVQYNYPKITFITRVSSGTYIRSLAEDIGNALGTGAYMSALRRTQIGEHSLLNACTVEELTDTVLQKSIAA